MDGPDDGDVPNATPTKVIPLATPKGPSSASKTTNPCQDPSTHLCLEVEGSLTRVSTMDGLEGSLLPHPHTSEGIASLPKKQETSFVKPSSKGQIGKWLNITWATT